jgi:hypothetical protein
MTALEELEKRIAALEKGSAFGKKPPKVPRKPSEYNKFVQKYIKEHKDPNKPFKDIFMEASKAWNESKKTEK